MKKNTGRRNGASTTKDHIAAVARTIFAERGYSDTTMRGIAKEAAVDPTLIIHFYKSKENLFTEVVAPIYLPLQELPSVLSGDRGAIGERLAGYIVDLLEDPVQGKIAVGLVRVATEGAAPAHGALFEERILKVFAAYAKQDAPDLRAALTCSAYLGYVMTRYVLHEPHLTSLTREQAVTALQPTLQQHLEG